MMVKVTLYEYTRDMMRANEGNTFHVDIVDRNGNSGGLADPATDASESSGSRKGRPAQMDLAVGSRQGGNELDQWALKTPEQIRQDIHDAIEFDGGVNWPETKPFVPKPEDIKAEEAFFKRIGLKP